MDPLQKYPKGRGPWGTVEGDCWLMDDSPVGQDMVAEGKHLVIEVTRMEDGRLTEGIYTTTSDELVTRARRGRRLWDAQGRHMPVEITDDTPLKPKRFDK